MMIPAAPVTPACQEPAVLTTLPFLYSLVSSPMYQTLPSLSWAYQSNVSSIVSPSCVNVSRTTVTAMPPICFVWSVTVMTSFEMAPSASTSRYSHSDPTARGQYGLSIVVTKFAGSSVIGSLACGRRAVDAVADGAAEAPEVGDGAAEAPEVAFGIAVEDAA